jgi:hypothetical protein
MAIDLARQEASPERSVMVMFPTPAWLPEAYKALAFKEEPPKYVFLRSTTVHSNLKSLVPTTLILVAPDASDWDEVGERWAREKNSIHPEGRVIVVGAKP